MIVDLSSPDAGVAAIGGKGRSLADALKMSRNVPPAFALDTAAFETHLAQPPVAAALDACRKGPGTRTERAAFLRETICKTDLAPRLADGLRTALERLGPGPFAVRSSALDEDGASRSFAGIHDTVLGASSLADVTDAIRRVWASTFGDRAIAYRSESGQGSPLDARMAVVVQRLVPAELSGVAFTRDPRTGEARFVIEAVKGLGEALVSGHVTPSRFVLDPASSAVVERSGDPILSDTQLVELAALARSLADQHKAPQDVEWSFAEGRLWLLQSRPITAGPRPTASTGPRQLWSNTNAAEVLPDVATPATFDIVRGYVAQLLGPILTELGLDLDPQRLLGRVAGRVYFNLNAMVAMLRSIPGANIEDFASKFGGDSESVRAAILSLKPDELPPARLGKLRFLKGVARISWHALFPDGTLLSRDLALYKEGTRRHLAIDVTTLPDAALVPHLRSSLATSFVSFEGLAAMIGGFAAVDLLGTVGRKWLGDRAFAGRLLTAMGGLDSAEAGLALVRLGRTARRLGLADTLAKVDSDARAEELLGGPEYREFALEFTQFLAEHGHHARGEVDAAVPRWRETPAYVLRQVAALALSGGDTGVPDEERRRTTREAVLADALSKLGPIRRRIVRSLFRRASETLTFRENAKSEAVRRLAQVRVGLLEAGRRLAAREVIARADDVFLLELDELHTALTTPFLDWTRRVARRGAELERLRALRPPGLVIGEFDPAGLPSPSTPTRAEGVLHGLAVSAGVAEGLARVVENADAGVVLRPGEVLVAPFTDPGWTPYFVGASAVVMEFGGQLSHGSIVAREYGLPAVVNVADVMRRVRTGQRLRVDGDAGTVTILGEPDASG